MLAFDVAHVRVRDTDLILVPVAAGFATLRPTQQRSLAARLQGYATKAGLAGVVVPVWLSPTGVMTFFAVPALRTVVELLSWSFVAAQINCRIVVGNMTAKLGPQTALPGVTTAPPRSRAVAGSRGRKSSAAGLEARLFTAC